MTMAPQALGGGLTSVGESLHCMTEREYTLQQLEGATCPGVDGIRVYFRRPPGDALGTFATALQQQGISLTNRASNTLTSKPAVIFGSPYEISYRAAAEPTRDGSILVITGYRQSPRSGTQERIVVSREQGAQAFQAMAALVQRTYDEPQIRYIKGAPEARSAPAGPR